MNEVKINVLIDCYFTYTQAYSMRIDIWIIRVKQMVFCKASHFFVNHQWEASLALITRKDAALLSLVEFNEMLKQLKDELLDDELVLVDQSIGL